MKKHTKEEFITKAKEIHGDKYSYEKSEYVNFDTKLEIICKEHGSFWQTPGNHLKGKGCPYCSNNAKMTTETFIQKAKEKWGDRFNYDKVTYINNSTKICIIDTSNGKEYWQTPANHLYGFDCTNNKINIDEVITECNKVHNNEYDYSKVKYKNAKEKVTIICPVHGEFKQLLYNHLIGQGCPECKCASNLEKRIEQILQNLHIKFEKQKKFEWMGKKSIDFFLKEYKIGIECQGKQHLYETGQWEKFEVIFNRDKLKYKECSQHKINLIYIINNKEKRIPEFYNDKEIIKIDDIEGYLVNQVIKKENEK